MIVVFDALDRRCGRFEKASRLIGLVRDNVESVRDNAEATEDVGEPCATITMVSGQERYVIGSLDDVLRVLTTV